MKQITIKPSDFPCKLGDCPPGLFLFNEIICLKSDYHMMALFNSRFRSKRFDFLGEGLTARMFRQGLHDLPEILRGGTERKTKA